MNDRMHMDPACERREDGIALIAALWLMVVVAGIVTVGTLVLQAHRAQTSNRFVENSQALLIARSGLIEARGWLRRQTSQPVLQFEPVLDQGASPPILDTIDPDIGIVREFPVAGRLWGRYEVWKEWAADPDPARLALRQSLQCRDISLAKGATGAGAIWQINSVGYIYERADSSLPFDQRPNRIVAREVVGVEAQRLILQLPGQAALNVGDGNNCHVNTNGRIVGGATAGGIYYPSASGTPTVGPANANRVTGTPALATATGYDDSYQHVFSMSLSQLESMASMVLTDLASFPNPVPDGSLIVVKSTSMTFDSAAPLKGNGIVILVGNVSIIDGSNSNFSGFLYVDGNLTMRAPSEIRGAAICTGNLTLQGIGDFATIVYDEEILAVLRQSFGSYNLSSAVQRPLHQDL